MVNDHQNDWDDLLENILFAYRTTRQGSTNALPSYILMFGREARLPIGVRRVKHTGKQHDELSFETKVEKMLDMQKPCMTRLVRISMKLKIARRGSMMPNTIPGVV